VGLFWLGISLLGGRYLHKEQHEHKINGGIHAFSGIRCHDPSVQAEEDSSCLRPRGHFDRTKADQERKFDALKQYFLNFLFLQPVVFYV
jgi:hypothetical protein